MPYDISDISVFRFLCNIICEIKSPVFLHGKGKTVIDNYTKIISWMWNFINRDPHSFKRGLPLVRYGLTLTWVLMSSSVGLAQTEIAKPPNTDTDCCILLHRYQEPEDLEDDLTDTVLKIYKDSATSSESKHRCVFPHHLNFMASYKITLPYHLVLHFNSNNEIHLSDYKWDPKAETHPRILPAEKLKTNDYNWQGKQRSQEAAIHKEIQL